MTLPFRVLVITDEGAARTRTRGVMETLARAFDGPAEGAAILVRAKDAHIDDVETACRALAPIARRARALLLVHTHVSLVEKLGLDGAHLSSTDDAHAARRALPARALLGASRHAGDVVPAELDYATLSPIFSPNSKRDTRAPLGVDALRAASHVALVALGGVDDKNAATCTVNGASAIAVIGHVMAAHDPRRALVRLLDATASR